MFSLPNKQLQAQNPVRPLLENLRVASAPAVVAAAAAAATAPLPVVWAPAAAALVPHLPLLCLPAAGGRGGQQGQALQMRTAPCLQKPSSKCVHGWEEKRHKQANEEPAARQQRCFVGGHADQARRPAARHRCASSFLI